MSNHLISLVYTRQLGSIVRKSVLVLMADKASDNGDGIYASKQTMADELCCSRQTVITTIKSLEDDGIVFQKALRRFSNGYTVEYCIDITRVSQLPLVACHHRRDMRAGFCELPPNEDDGPQFDGSKPQNDSDRLQFDGSKARPDTTSIKLRRARRPKSVLREAKLPMDVSENLRPTPKRHHSPVNDVDRSNTPVSEKDAYSDSNPSTSLTGELLSADVNNIDGSIPLTGQSVLRPPSRSFTSPVNEVDSNPPLTILEPDKDKERARAKSLLPEGWTPAEFHKSSQCFAIAAKWSASERTAKLEAFAAHHRKNATLYADWQAAWETWVLYSLRYDSAPGTVRSAETVSQADAPEIDLKHGFAMSCQRHLRRPMDETLRQLDDGTFQLSADELRKLPEFLHPSALRAGFIRRDHLEIALNGGDL